MATILLGVTDTHWSPRKPRSRRDDFIATQVRKIQDIVKLSKRLNWRGRPQSAQAIIHSGDMFHNNKGDQIDRSLDTTLISAIQPRPECPWLAIPGNHDMENDRVEALKSHPMGVFHIAGVVDLVIWPHYRVVKGPEPSDPPVIVTGIPYTQEGPAKWLAAQSVSQDLVRLKRSIAPNAHVVLMTHCHWGPVEGQINGEPIVAHYLATEAGATVHMYGHPHTNDGVSLIQGPDGPISIVGPGALIRGTLAEHDVNRQPNIMIAAFNGDGTHECVLVPIPHEPAEVVFDLEKHERQRQERVREERFVQQLRTLTPETTDPEQLLVAASDRTPARVLMKTRSFIEEATIEMNQ